MQLIRDWVRSPESAISSDRPRGVMTIGNFDGVHLGHMALLKQVMARAAAAGLVSQVMLFEPQPLEYFMPNKAPARLMTLRNKLEHLRHLGLDQVFCLRFNASLAELSPKDFVTHVLVNTCGVQQLIVGDDFCFGKDRAGDFDYLVKAGHQWGFEVAQTQSVLVAEQRISSTHIRQLLANDQFDAVQAQLGRPFTLTGRVIRGDQRGRQLGFPTANILLNRIKIPLQGVFAVQVIVGGSDKMYCGVANMGVRPTVQEDHARSWLEVHLLNFNGNLYQARLTVMVRKKFRSEQKFASLSALKIAIGEDVAKARAYFNLGTEDERSLDDGL